MRKSRKYFNFNENSGMKYQIINYLNDNLKIEDLKSIIDKLDLKPIDLVRKNE